MVPIKSALLEHLNPGLDRFSDNVDLERIK